MPLANPRVDRSDSKGTEVGGYWETANWAENAEHVQNTNRVCTRYIESRAGIAKSFASATLNAPNA
eukprot:11184918-Lingulodinium_polyedra.AAC.1